MAHTLGVDDQDFNGLMWWILRASSKLTLMSTRHINRMMSLVENFADILYYITFFVRNLLRFY